MLKTVDNRFQWQAEANAFDKKNDLSPIRITLADYEKAGAECRLLIPNINAKRRKDDDPLIISVMPSTNGELPLITTGNFIGEFTYDGRKFSISSRFSDVFLKRMLNFANDIYFDDVDVLPLEKSNDTSSFSRLILRYLFVQSLEKAYLLGFPKAYTAIHDDGLSIKGRLEISRFIQHAIPFRGKLPTISREMVESQDIADILLRVIQIIEKDICTETKKPIKSDALVNIRHVIRHLREVRSGKPFTNETLIRAKKHKALQNPMFAPYKIVLRYAEYIIHSDSMKHSKTKENVNFSGFLVNVAELFEIYVTKLLQRNLPDYTVHSPEIVVHENKFFKRRIIPDIVIEGEGKVLVFDTKYKRMKFEGSRNYGMGDLDREDFFQINTYMAYYAFHAGINLISGGLIYPIDCEISEDEIPQEDNWLQNQMVQFCVHGIQPSILSKADEDQINKSEDKYLEEYRIRITKIKESENKLIKFIQSKLDQPVSA